MDKIHKGGIYSLLQTRGLWINSISEKLPQQDEFETAVGKNGGLSYIQADTVIF